MPDKKTVTKAEHTASVRKPHQQASKAAMGRAPEKSRYGPKEKRPYHHGGLRTALLDAAETILRRDGIEALTLRATAREAGVSHAAPKNHFDNLTGLLSDLAARGYARFGAHLSPDTTQPAPEEAARRYVSFARDNPDLFVLMFRNTRLDYERPALKIAANAALAGLTGQAGGTSEDLTFAQLTIVSARWALVHGFAMLMIDGRLDVLTGMLDDEERNVDEIQLLDAILSKGSREPDDMST